MRVQVPGAPMAMPMTGVVASRSSWSTGRTSARPIRGAKRPSSRRQLSVSSVASEAATRFIGVLSVLSAAGQVAQRAIERGGVGGDPGLGTAELVQHHEADAVPVLLVPHPGLLHVRQPELALDRQAEP